MRSCWPSLLQLVWLQQGMCWQSLARVSHQTTSAWTTGNTTMLASRPFLRIPAAEQSQATATMARAKVNPRMARDRHRPVATDLWAFQRCCWPTCRAQIWLCMAGMCKHYVQWRSHCKVPWLVDCMGRTDGRTVLGLSLTLCMALQKPAVEV